LILIFSTIHPPSILQFVNEQSKPYGPDSFHKQGNRWLRWLRQLSEATANNSHVTPKPQLPINFYDASLGDAKLAMLPLLPLL
jgi:hypothetical protein